MKTTHSGRAALAREEAVILVGYPDSRRIPTIAVGHTASAGPPKPIIGHKITLAEAMDIFARDLRKFEDRVNRLVKVPLAPNEFDALVSFDFNTGGLRYKSKRTGKMVDSSLLRAVNGRKGANAIKAGFLAWSRAGSNPSALKGRRLREFAMYDRGDYGSIATVPVSEVWPPRYKQVALPEDSEDAVVPIPEPRPQPEPEIEPADEADDITPTDYNPDVDGPAVPEPPKPLAHSKTIWGNFVTWFGGTGLGASLIGLLNNPHAIWLVIAVLAFVLIGGIAAAVVFRERLLKRLELGV